VSRDRVGVSWRPGLAATILSSLDEVDVVEVLADDHIGRPRSWPGLRLLARRVPVVLHGNGLGLASAAPVDGRRLDRMARLCAAVEPEAWSEHLAFVRAGDLEIGGLAAPPRTLASVEAARRNLAGARRVVGSAPLIENVASLIDPPASALDEPTWIAAILDASDGPLLLDLHNLHANATNFGWPATRLLDAIPAARVGMVHVAGGSWVTGEHTGGQRLLDDHGHDVPEAVYRLLAELAARAPGPLTVVVERDHGLPTAAELRAELARVREALARGRAARPR
jgi:hypothetical protein